MAYQVQDRKHSAERNAKWLGLNKFSRSESASFAERDCVPLAEMFSFTNKKAGLLYQIKGCHSSVSLQWQFCSAWCEWPKRRDPSSWNQADWRIQQHTRCVKTADYWTSTLLGMSLFRPSAAESGTALWSHVRVVVTSPWHDLITWRVIGWRSPFTLSQGTLVLCKLCGWMLDVLCRWSWSLSWTPHPSATFVVRVLFSIRLFCLSGK